MKDIERRNSDPLTFCPDGMTVDETINRLLAKEELRGKLTRLREHNETIKKLHHQFRDASSELTLATIRYNKAKDAHDAAKMFYNLAVTEQADVFVEEMEKFVREAG